MTGLERLAKALYGQFWPDRDVDWLDSVWTANDAGQRENYQQVVRWFLRWLFGRDLTGAELAGLEEGCVEAMCGEYLRARVTMTDDLRELVVRALIGGDRRRYCGDEGCPEGLRVAKALVLLGVARELWPPRAQAAWERYKGGPR